MDARSPGVFLVGAKQESFHERWRFMSGIQGASPAVHAAHAAHVQKAAPQKPVAVASPLKDADGDHDGTKVGQSDPMDAGKGQNINKRA